jgi:hypothetical protein
MARTIRQLLPSTKSTAGGLAGAAFLVNRQALAGFACIT